MWGEIRKGKAEGFKKSIGKQKEMWIYDIVMYIQNAPLICAQLCREILGFRG